MISSDSTINVYRSALNPGVRIESRRIKVSHSNNVGYWEYTTFFVVYENPVKEKEFGSLREAKAAAERFIFKKKEVTP